MVRNAIVAAAGVTTADDVTAEHLANISSLNLRSRSITSLSAGDFNGLIQLSFLDLEANELRSLPAGLFDELTALETLALGSNELSSLPSGLFDNLSALRRLFLGGNELSTLPAGLFDGLSQMTFLHLNNNELTTLPSGLFDRLSALTLLDLENNELSTLPSGLFNDLSKLTNLNVGYNNLSSVPPGTFNGLFALERLYLWHNAIEPMRFTVSLEKVEEGKVKAVMPAGAPFDLAVRVRIKNGSLADGATKLRIPKGTGESESIAVTRTPGTTDAVTVNIRPLPILPKPTVLHYGYKPVKPATGLPVEIYAAGVGDIGHSVDRDDPPQTLITAEFQSVPEEHNSTAAFGIDLVFSEQLAANTQSQLKRTLSVTSGTVEQVFAVQKERDRWRIKVQPSSSDAVTVLLAADGDCATVPCSDDGRPLSQAISTTIVGPPGLSVADAEVEEGPDAVLGRAVTAHYETFDGTATEGEDYARAYGTLTFAAGETSKTVSVLVLDDSHDEGIETLTFRLEDPVGAWLNDGEAEGTIKNSDPMPKAWLARFGRTASQQVMEAIEESAPQKIFRTFFRMTNS